MTLLCGLDPPVLGELSAFDQPSTQANSVSPGDFAGQTLSVKIVYHILSDPNVPDSYITIDRLKQQHIILNQCFLRQNAKNAETPTVFTNSIGNPLLTFAPANLDDLTEESDYVERHNTSRGREFTGIADILSYLNNLNHYDATIKGALNVYICVLAGNILGQAYISGNQACVDYGTVGSFDMPGSINGYSHGVTLVHEVGHSMGQEHTFGESIRSQCQADRLVYDIPRQFSTNATMTLQNALGIWATSGENRELDCDGIIVKADGNTNAPFSCVNQLPSYDCGNPSPEFGFSFMDYARDEYMTTFSGGQSELIRERLLVNNNNLDVSLLDGTPLFTSGDDDKLPLWAIITIVAVGLAIIIIPVSVVLAKKRKS